MSAMRETGADPDVSYGDWEPDPDVPPIYSGIMPGWRGGPVTMHPRPGGYRRKRFETWPVGDGRKGRWTWERRSA
jgi:hypothetical protein